MTSTADKVGRERYAKRVKLLLFFLAEEFQIVSSNGVSGSRKREKETETETERQTDRQRERENKKLRKCNIHQPLCSSYTL